MASKKDIEAGRATVRLFADTNPLMKGLKSVQGTMNAWGKSIMGAGAGVTALGAAIVGPLVGAVSVFASRGSELADLAAKTNLSASAIAELGFAAEQSGSDLATVGKALIAMQKQGLDPKRFDEIAAAISAIPDDVERTNAALAAFGKSGAELLPMLADVTKLRQQARDLGIIPSEEAVQDAAIIGDKFDQVKNQIVAGIFEIGAAFAPVLKPALEAITNIGKRALDWVRANAGLVRTIGAIGAGLLIAGGIITTIGAGIVAASAVLGGIATVVSTIGTVLAAAASPVGLIVAGIAAIGVGIVAAIGYWLLFTEHGKGTIIALKAGFAQVLAIIGSIGEALKSGNIELAAKIAATGMRLAFFTAIDGIIERIMFIPRAIIDAMRPIAELDPTGTLMNGIHAANGVLTGLKTATGVGAGTSAAELDALRKQAAAGLIDDGNAGQYSTSGMGNAGAMNKLKSFGSFGTNALTMQNFGSGVAAKSGDPQKDAAEFLKTLTKKLIPDLIAATKDNQMAYGA